MAVEIRELKSRYKTSLALGQVLPTHDLAIPLPLSTGSPLYDAALCDKLVATTTLNEPEHLGRAWKLVRSASRQEHHTLGEHAGGLLNDYKLLLALRAWDEGDEALTRKFLRALPWGWRLSFPTAVIKPAAHVFTGWRKSVRFRLVSEPRFEPLRALFRELLGQAKGVTIQKYRRRIKESAALLRFRFEGDRERAIHDLCFNNGRKLEGSADLDDSLEPIGTYLRARRALQDGGAKGFATALHDSEHDLPITSFMGLLGSAGLQLRERGKAKDSLRDYAVRCATAVESLLRLAEWSPWLNEARAEELAQTVQRSVIERGIDIPFFKVVKAFMAAPPKTKKLVLEPLLIPLLRHFGGRVAGRLGGHGPLTFMQPGNVVHIMSFLLYTVIASASETRLFLLYDDGVEEVPSLPVDEVARHLADNRRDLESWLLGQFGGLTARSSYVYDFPAITKQLGALDPKAPLLLDLPFARSTELLSALLPFERVFNLNAPYGAPGEVCIAYEYYASFLLQSPRMQWGIWSRYSDRAAQRFAEFLDRLHLFQTLAEARS